MRTALVAITLAGVNLVLAEPPPAQISPPPRSTVYLYGAADLDQLQKTNPDHYARAQRILAAADHLCKPGPPRSEFAAAAAREVRCSPLLLKTSNPPKLSLSFVLDDNRYIALVPLTSDSPRLTPAH